MGSFKQIYYQIVFGTKHRKPTISNDYCEELYKYIWGVISAKKCKLYRINGVEDHIHIFCDLHPTIALADLIKGIKVSSSIWMKTENKFPDFEGWQDGYGAFTYNNRDKQASGVHSSTYYPGNEYVWQISFHCVFVILWLSLWVFR